MYRQIPFLTAALGALLLTPAAFASHPEPGQMSKVRILAHELENSARHLHRTAERRAHHYDRYEARALRALHKLEDRARHFHREVERYYRDPYHTERDFHRLEDAYYDAVHYFGDLHAEYHVRHDWLRVRDLMSRLRYYYRGADPYRGDGYDHGRYGHGHYRPHHGFRLWFDYRR